MMEKTG